MSSGMAQSEQQKAGFEDRLGRIARGGENTNGQLFVGNDQEARPKRHRGAAASGGGGVMRRIGRLVFALGAGWLSAIFGGAMVFRFASEEAGASEEIVEMAATYQGAIILGLVGAFILRQLFSLKTKGLTLLVVGGMLGALVMEKELMAAYPGIYAKAFSKDYVASVIAE
ncbi:MAG: hypothetical protein HUJ27_13185 [Rhodobacteraceae bacterium]|nr:hypothetical protein [Paracoccaceae bacterium]